MLLFMRGFLVIFASFSGFAILLYITGNENLALIGLVSGLIISVLALIFEERVRKSPLRIVVGGSIGLITGLIVANLLALPLAKFIDTKILELALYFLSNTILGYVGLSIGMKQGDDLKNIKLQSLKFWGKEDAESRYAEGTATKTTSGILIDTSVIIDGRILDITKTGFMDGDILVTQFVLGELQAIADSTDPIKRARGKRGLEVLKKLQEDENIKVEISELDATETRAVDAKLIQLGKDFGLKVLTNDSNLHKVAELQGVVVLNINALANALKPVVLPGELFSIRIQKEGKEAGQGVGFLEDGTMVVIDNAGEHIGKTVGVFVTSVLQTSGGRMIFSKVKEDEDGVYQLHANN